MNYHSLTGSNLTTFSVGVVNGVYGHPTTFPAPTITQLAIEALIDAFVTENAAYEGHTATKAEMEDKKAELMAGLDTEAAYVNTITTTDPTIIELAGFIATKGNGTKKNKPGQVTGITLDRGISRELISECPVTENAEGYGALLVANNPLPPNIVITDGGQILIEDDGMPGPSPGAVPLPGSINVILDLTKGRKKTFSNLQIGTTYYVYYWAMNSAGVSVLSDGVSRSVIE